MDSQGSRFFILDLMRFGAAFSVVLYHLTASTDTTFETLSQITKFGYLGVPAFFMISGFLIAISANGRTAYEFGVSRFARIYPGLWACIVITVLAVYLTTGTTFDIYRVAANTTLLNEYFGHKNIDIVYWTLHQELKFYGCIFLLLAFGVFHHYRIWLTTWLVLSMLHLVTGQPWFMGWFISPAWSPFFIVGVAFYHIHAFGAGRFNMGILGGALITACTRLYSIADEFIVSTDTLDAIISVFILLTFAGLLLLAAADRQAGPPSGASSHCSTATTAACWP